MLLPRYLFGLTLVGLAGSLSAIELPTPVGEEDFKELSTLSPFSRPLDLSDTLSLTGFAKIGDESIITLRDSESKKSHLVSAQSNDEGWKLVEVNKDGGDRPENLLAQIAVPGGEVIEIQFDEDRIDPEHMRHRASGKNGGPPRDNRLPPTKEEKEKFGKYIKERMGKMTDAQRKEVGRIMKEKMQEMGDKMSDRQKGETFMRIMDYVQKQGPTGKR